ncbi:uncharacterized protein CBL_12593 [Carabus blaptoides fortunei]
MKFRFCGDADCPDWVLAEITLLSRLSSIKLKLLTRDVVQSIVSPPLDITKAEKLFTDSKLDPDADLKRCIACLTFILTSAARFTCDPGVLGNELQQLGLPREHSQSIRKVYVDHSGTLTGALRDKSFRVNKLEKITVHDVPALNAADLELTVDGVVKKVRVPKVLLRAMLDDMEHVHEEMKDSATFKS